MSEVLESSKSFHHSSSSAPDHSSKFDGGDSETKSLISISTAAPLIITSPSSSTGSFIRIPQRIDCPGSYIERYTPYSPSSSSASSSSLVNFLGPEKDSGPVEGIDSGLDITDDNAQRRQRNWLKMVAGAGSGSGSLPLSIASLSGSDRYASPTDRLHPHHPQHNQSNHNHRPTDLARAIPTPSESSSSSHCQSPDQYSRFNCKDNSECAESPQPGQLKAYFREASLAFVHHDDYRKSHRPEGFGNSTTTVSNNLSNKKVTLPSFRELLIGAKCYENPLEVEDAFSHPPSIPPIGPPRWAAYDSAPPPHRYLIPSHQPLSTIESDLARGQPQLGQVGQARAAGYRDYRKRAIKETGPGTLKPTRSALRVGTSPGTAGVHTTPRQRVPMACSFCRARKLRCTPSPGPCEHCKRRGHDCFYDDKNSSSSASHNLAAQSSQPREPNAIKSPTGSLPSPSSSLTPVGV